MIVKTKQKYVKPHMEVYELKQHAPLLTTSGGDYPQWDPENI